jgi:hypothetical protein
MEEEDGDKAGEEIAGGEEEEGFGGRFELSARLRVEFVGRYLSVFFWSISSLSFVSLDFSLLPLILRMTPCFHRCTHHLLRGLPQSPVRGRGCPTRLGLAVFLSIYLAWMTQIAAGCDAFLLASVSVQARRH